MNVTRRGFMGALLALGAAPALVKAESLMRIARPTQGLILPLGLAGVVREIRTYDVHTDRFLTRWDVVGRVDGERRQLHVGVIENNDPRPLVAVDGQQLYLTGCAVGSFNLPATRELALTALRERISKSGMEVERGVLQLPEGMAHARFLS